MKKTLLLLSVFVGFAFGASAQCMPNPADTAHFTSSVHSYPDTVYAPNGTALSGQVITFNIPNDLSYTGTFPIIGTQTISIHVDSIRIDSITGEPSAIMDAGSPALGTWMKPGQQGCISFTGITTVAAGNYPLTVTGTVRFDTTIFSYHIDTVVSRFPLSSTYPMTVHVANPVGISEVLADVNLSIYPNPNQGAFTVTVSSASRLTGSMSVVDQLGRTITTQNLDVTGTKQIPLELGNIAPGAYALLINTQNGKSVKQFIVK